MNTVFVFMVGVMSDLKHFLILTIVLIHVQDDNVFVSSAFDVEVNPKNSLIYGPGLHKGITLPVRYFNIQSVDVNKQK